MAAWSQSPFLQALGWAMLNSLWQMAVLFFGFSVLQQFVRLSSSRKYYLAVAGLGIGFCWFVYTFFVFFQNGTAGTLLTQHPLAPTANTWNLILSSASLAYLLLMLLPAYRLFNNWRYIGRLKKLGLQKTAMQYRLFVKKIAQHLGIKHTVHVYLSHLVQSPVTVGYLKPIILLPIAALNNLSPQQVEAVLLHELSHIRRYDYLINLVISFLHTIFYFNPFVKLFVSHIEFEREKCCDELVLQFGYDKISYASALLQLEKSVLAAEALAVAAAGKKHLLRRIEKIVGLEKKGRITFHQFAGLFASFVVVLLINSLFYVKQEVVFTKAPTFAAIESPFYPFEETPAAKTFSKAHVPVASRTVAPQPAAPNVPAAPIEETAPPFPIDEQPAWVAYDASNEMVSPEEELQIDQTLETTKEVLTKTKWKEVEASIGDGMTAIEKKVAEDEYLKEVAKVDWKAVESHLKAQYEVLNWDEIHGKLSSALADLKLDSLQTVYHQALTQMQRAEAKTGCKAALLIPDASLEQINFLKTELKVKLDSIKVIRDKKIINF